MQDNGRKQFLWGVATSSYQIEGQIDNDHSEWEAMGRFKNDQHDPKVGLATDHWHRWESDFELLKQLGVNSYRFSIEWARIEPERGKIDTAALDQYERMIDRLLELNITPMVTLHHFTHPQWFIKRTPWHLPSAVGDFIHYVELVAERLLKKVPYVVTFNEPLVWLLAAYGDAKFPPGERSTDHLMQALHNMLMAHREAYDRIKAVNPATKIGIAHNFIVFRASRRGHIMDKLIKRKIHYFYNLMLPEAFKTNRIRFYFPLLVKYDAPISLDNRIDFWGINYYYRMHVRFRMNPARPFDFFFYPRSGEGVSDLGWEVYSRGLEKVCRWLDASGKPLIITENGIAAEDDEKRTSFLNLHLATVEKLIKTGRPIEGYYHWSMLDNYEWLIGTSARFGLYHVDYLNGLGRKLKPSGAFYRDYIRNSLG